MVGGKRVLPAQMGDNLELETQEQWEWLGFSVLVVQQDFLDYEAWFYNQNDSNGGTVMSAYAF